MSISNLCETCRVKQKTQKLGTLTDGVKIGTDHDFETGELKIKAIYRVGAIKYAVATKISRESLEAKGDSEIQRASEFLTALITGKDNEKYVTEAMATAEYVEMPQVNSTISNQATSHQMATQYYQYLPAVDPIIKDHSSQFQLTPFDKEFLPSIGISISTADNHNVGTYYKIPFSIGVAAWKDQYLTGISAV